MEVFEARLENAVEPDNADILGAIAIVFDSAGAILYNHAAGRQSLSKDIGSLGLDTTIILGSAGKICCHIAVAQLVERGTLMLDEPIFRLVPELERLQIISSAPDNPSGFSLRPRQKPMTLRHMLSYSSGIPGNEEPLVEKWKAAVPPENYADGTHFIVKNLSSPLLFEPGGGWNYGHDVHWLQLVIERASGREYVDYIHENIFEPLGMTSSSYGPRKDLLDRKLQMVQRNCNGELEVAPEHAVSGLICSISDLQKILTELISPVPKILSKESIDQFVQPAFSNLSDSLASLRVDTENFAEPAGIPKDMPLPPVNWAWGGLFVENKLPLSHLPTGTVTWNGMPNVVWAVHRSKGVGMLFATQLLPVDDEKTVSILLEFFRGAISKFW